MVGGRAGNTNDPFAKYLLSFINHGRLSILRCCE